MNSTGKTRHTPDHENLTAGNHGLRLHITRQTGYLVAEVPKEMPKQSGDETRLLASITAACKNEQLSNVLVIGADLWVNTSTMEILELGSCIAETGLRIAVLMSGEVPEENVQFLDNVVWNRGGMLRFFDNQAKAEAWLKMVPTTS